MEHTKGKLLLDGRTIYQLNEKGFNRFFASVHDAHTDESELKAVARRLVACWNAAEGLDTEAIEIADTFKTIMNDYGKDRDRLQAINAELVAALEAMVREYEGYFEGASEPDSLLLARAALAKAKEAAK